MAFLSWGSEYTGIGWSVRTTSRATVFQSVGSKCIFHRPGLYSLVSASAWVGRDVSPLYSLAQWHNFWRLSVYVVRHGRETGAKYWAGWRQQSIQLHEGYENSKSYLLGLHFLL